MDSHVDGIYDIFKELGYKMHGQPLVVVMASLGLFSL